MFEVQLVHPESDTFELVFRGSLKECREYVSKQQGDGLASWEIWRDDIEYFLEDIYDG